MADKSQQPSTETAAMESFADGKVTLRISLFTSLRNAKELKSNVLQQQLPVALINPHNVSTVC